MRPRDHSIIVELSEDPDFLAADGSFTVEILGPPQRTKFELQRVALLSDDEPHVLSETVTLRVTDMPRLAVGPRLLLTMPAEARGRRILVEYESIGEPVGRGSVTARRSRASAADVAAECPEPWHDYYEEMLKEAIGKEGVFFFALDRRTLPALRFCASLRPAPDYLPYVPGFETDMIKLIDTFAERLDKRLDDDLANAPPVLDPAAIDGWFQDALLESGLSPSDLPAAMESFAAGMLRASTKLKYSEGELGGDANSGNVFMFAELCAVMLDEFPMSNLWTLPLYRSTVIMQLCFLARSNMQSSLENYGLPNGKADEAIWAWCDRFIPPDADRAEIDERFHQSLGIAVGPP